MIRPGLALLYCCASVALAAESPEGLLTEAEFFNGQPVVLSASKLSPPRDRAPVAVTVITREMIEASGFRHLVDVLRLVPGFVVGWPGGNMPVASYTGRADSFPHWLQIMVDGFSVYNPSYGHAVWRGLPLTLDDIDRIEVVRGPNAAADGLNSMLGTIHIYTRHSSLSVGNMAELVAGEVGVREASLRHGARTESGSWRVGLMAREDRRHGVGQDQARDVLANFRGDFRFGLRDDVMLQFGAARGDWRGSNVGQPVAEGQHALLWNGHGSLQWQRTLSEGREWLFQLHHIESRNKEELRLPPPIDPLRGDYVTTSSGVQFSYRDKSESHWRNSLTGEFRLNRVRLPDLLDSDGYLNDRVARFSGELEWTVSPSLVWHGAAMLEYHSDLDEVLVSPRLAVNWLPVDGHSFRFGVARGSSAMALYPNHVDIALKVGGELYDQWYRGTGEMIGEKVDSLEFGYLYAAPSLGLSLDLRAFRHRGRDIGDSAPIVVPEDPHDGRARTYVNDAGFTQRGLEYQLSWQPSQGGSLVLSQAWLKSVKEDGEEEASVPRHVLSVQASQRIGPVDASLGYYLIDKVRWLGSSRDSRYNRLDFRLARAWQTSSGRLTTALGLQGLLGGEQERFTRATGPYSDQRFERRGYLSLKYEFD